MKKRLLIIFILGFSSGLPLALLTSTLQAWFAQAGMSVMATGMLSLLGLPYLYRIFWGPILDRYALLPMGRRRSWILVTQCLLCVGFNALAWFSPAQSPVLMATIGFLLACCSATQDIAIDAHRTEYLPEAEHALGASLAVLGYRIALLIAGGLALIIAQHWGFSLAYRMMGLLMALGMIAIYFSPEPSAPQQTAEPFLTSLMTPVKELLQRPGIVPLVLFIFFYKLGEAFTTTTSGIVMPFLIQNLAFSLDTIAYVNKILGIGAILLGGIVSGFLLLRWSLYRALFCFGVLQALTNLLFVALAVVGKNYTLFALAVVSDNFSAGLGATALVAFIMRVVDRRFTATQFSILVTLSTLPRILSGPVGALMQKWLGWVGVYQCAFVLALVFIPFLYLIRQQTYGLKVAA